MIVNFLKDTLNKMEENGVSPDDVLYVFNSFGYCSWEEFEKLANFDYNNGYGLVAIDLNLIVRGSDWWLESVLYVGYIFVTGIAYGFAADVAAVGICYYFTVIGNYMVTFL